LYAERGRTITVDSELLFDPAGMTVYTESIKSWDPPFDKEMLSANDRDRIIHNIVNDLQKHGYRVDLA